MFILGLVGKKQSGKDTVCEIVQKHWPGKKIIRIAFADALKQEVAQAIGQTVSYVDFHKNELRLLLQAWGTDFRRNLSGENYWIDKWLQKANLVKADGIIATDVRFLNEAEAIRELNGVLWRIVRLSKGTVDQHASETEQDSIKCDEVICNGHSLLELDAEVKLQLTKWTNV